MLTRIAHWIERQLPKLKAASSILAPGAIKLCPKCRLQREEAWGMDCCPFSRGE